MKSDRAYVDYLEDMLDADEEDGAVHRATERRKK